MPIRVPSPARLVLSLLFAALVAAWGPLQASVITQHFPADKSKEKMRTRWRVVWDIEKHGSRSEVLVIKAAYFQRSPEEKEIKVLGDCRLAEIFVPYYNNTRIYDISGHTFNLVTMDKAALGPNCVAEGTIYDRNGEVAKKGSVFKEVHDGQVRWMNAQEKLARGQAMDLWAVLNAANYRYIMLYQFRDDGMVTFKMGATAHNLMQFRDDRSTHIHVGFWRLHVPLGSATQTQVSLVENDQKRLKTIVKPLPWETALKWDPERFTRLRIESRVEKNSHSPSSPISYEVVPTRTGSPRYHGVGEEFTQYDFWVTRRRNNDIRPRELPMYQKDEPLKDRDVTIWHMSPAVHVARDEDFGEKDTKTGEASPQAGVAITAWAGFDLKPRNLFGKTQLNP